MSRNRPYIWLLLIPTLLLLSACGGRGRSTPSPVNVAELNLTPPTDQSEEQDLSEQPESRQTPEAEEEVATATPALTTETVATAITPTEVTPSGPVTPTSTLPLTDSLPITATATTAPPLPTSTPTFEPLAACTETLDPLEEDALTQAPALHCPAGEPATLYTASQPFDHGRMIWRSDQGKIYVLINDGRWFAFDDTFVEGSAEFDPALNPPPGRLQPVRGFGKVWRNELGGATAAIGWGTAPEKGLNATVQPWVGGLIITYAIDDRIAILDNGGWQQLE